MEKKPKEGSEIAYRADGESLVWEPWKSPLFMPRWASRIDLEIMEIRVERLQDISAQDCYAEGIPRPKMPGYGSEVVLRDNARNAYRSLWESIHGPKGWDLNPWVFCYSLKRTK